MPKRPGLSGLRQDQVVTIAVGRELPGTMGNSREYLGIALFFLKKKP
jgi:hypothetical protein